MLEKKSSFGNMFLGNFEILEHFFLSEIFQKSICIAVFSLAVGFVHVFFSIFPKISVNLFQNTSIKLSVSEFSRALGCGLQYYVLTVF